MIENLKGEIKNIIFDLGGVILNIDPDLTVDAMKEFGIKNFEKAYSHSSQNDLFDRLETGKVSPEEFRNEIRVVFGENLTDEIIDKFWGKLLLDFPNERIELLQRLKSHYRLFLLSNTNIIHYHMYNEDLKSKFGIYLNDLFEKAYYSFEIGMRKPDVSIFKYVLDKSNLNPYETLFIDDSSINIEAARKAGMITHYLDLSRNETIVELLDSF